MALKLAHPSFPRFDNDKIRVRAIAAILVGLGHVIAVMLIGTSRFPTERKSIVTEVETISFLPVSTGEVHFRGRRGKIKLKPLDLKRAKLDVSELLQSTPESVAKLPALPESEAPSGAGWQSEFSDVASDVIERARVEASRPMNRIPHSPSFSPLHAKPHTLAWVSQHSHEVIDEHGVPQWVLVQPCESEFLVQKPDCIVERVLPHGILFEYMAEQHDATLQYGGPNAIP
jgi:hypothetical protein